MVEEPLPRTLVEALWSRPSEGTEITLLGPGGDRETRSTSELKQRAEGWAGALSRHGVTRGAAVCLVARTSFEFIVGCLAIWRAGGAVVPLPPPPRGPRRGWEEDVASRSLRVKAKVLLGDPRDLRAGAPVSTVPFEGLDEAGASPPTDAPAASDVAVIQFSSGSTAKPKGVVFRHETMVRRLFRERHFDLSFSAPSDHVLRITPLHFAGVNQAVLRPVALGRRLTLMSPQDFMRDPARWIREIGEQGVTEASAPNFAYAMATREIASGKVDDVDLSGWHAAGCSHGEAADPATIASFVEAARTLGFRPESLYTTYALTETSVVATMPRGRGLSYLDVDRDALSEGSVAESGTTDGSTRIISAGPPLSDVQIAIFSDRGERLEERRMGEISVRSELLMDGYLDDPEASQAAFVDGWFKTGDLGFLAEGELFVAGRAKDVIIVHGQNFLAGDIEAVVSSAGLDGRCAAFPVRNGPSEALAIVLEHAGDANDAKRRIVSRVWKEMGLPVKDVIVVAPGTLPLTDSGKLRRTAVRRLFDAGELSST